MSPTKPHPTDTRAPALCPPCSCSKGGRCDCGLCADTSIAVTEPGPVFTLREARQVAGTGIFIGAVIGAAVLLVVLVIAWAAAMLPEVRS